MPEGALVLGPGERRRFWTALSSEAVKVESGSAGFSVFESSPPPGRPGPAPHLHRSYDEAWSHLGHGGISPRRPARAAEAGGFVFVPRGVVHSFANPGPAEARMLISDREPPGTGKRWQYSGPVGK